ncbi:MAG: hypothetical protein CL814_11720 [Confluentimicrobium sp.]|uniref:lipopolysaccharide biosynthesis protein n=1 Tax=Actibacterium sp. TaxID=1872125 RepID=UPI000C434C8F|nr:hypothetical protein [Actibacterium sp.]MBC57584.1 hypothetical protein [Actibacterium sp.]|tara:strand:+ start:7662 stop:9047 length:1386 start_codon:yes stop_codon:yes gene_type:complete
MVNNLRSRILLGSGANGLGLLARVATQLLIVPILLSAWSVPLYGEWLLISAIPIYLSLSDMGFVSAGSNELARRSQDGVTRESQSFYTDYVSTFASWSTLLLLFFVGIVFVAPVDEWLELELISRQEARIVFAFLIAHVLLSQNSLTIHAGLRACHRAHVAFLLRAASAICQTVVIAFLVLAFGAGPIGVAIATAGVRLAEVCLLAILSHRNGLTPRWRVFKRPNEPMWSYLTIGLEFMLLPLSQAIVLQGMVIMIGTTLGPVAVAAFSTHRTLTRMTSQVVQLAVTPLRAEAGLLQGEEQRPKLLRLVLRLSRMTFWASLIIAVALMVFGHWIFKIWTHGNIAFLPMVFFPLLLTTILEGVWRVPAAVRFGTNQHRPLVWSYFVLSLLGVAFAYFLGRIWGLNGVGYALVCIDGMMCILTIHYNSTLLRVEAGSFVRSILTPPIADIAYLIDLLKRRNSR